MTRTTKVQIGNFRTSNVMWVYCMACSYRFAKRRFPAKTQIKSSIRPSNVCTCSPQCAKKLKLLHYGKMEQ